MCRCCLNMRRPLRIASMHYKCRKCFVHHKRYFVQTVYDCPKWFRLLYENDYLAFVKTDTTFPQCDLSVRFSFGFSMHLNYNKGPHRPIGMIVENVLECVFHNFSIFPNRAQYHICLPQKTTTVCFIRIGPPDDSYTDETDCCGF